jgi:hypothetical protein
MGAAVCANPMLANKHAINARAIETFFINVVAVLRWTPPKIVIMSTLRRYA